MTEKRIQLAQLREQVGAILGHSTHERLSSSLLSAGVPRGTLVELSGPARVEWCLAFLREHPELKVCWLEERFTLLPTAVKQRGCNLEHFLFVEAGPELFKPLRKSIRSQVFDVLVTPHSFDDSRALKALQLLTEKANAVLFLLTPKATSAWQIGVQVECKPGNKPQQPETLVLKYKARNPGEETSPDGSAPGDETPRGGSA